MGASIIQPPAFQRSSGRLILNTFQANLTNNLWTLVLLDLVPAGFTDGIESTVAHTITPPQSGFYSIVGQVVFTNVVATKHYSCKVLAAGVLVMTGKDHSSFATDIFVQCVLPCKYLVAGEALELWAKSDSGDNTVDISDGSWTHLSIQRVR